MGTRALPLWGVALGLALGALACSGLASGLPGTVTCKQGTAERTYRCSEVCNQAKEARSSTEREDLVRCAEDSCGITCE